MLETETVKSGSKEIAQPRMKLSLDFGWKRLEFRELKLTQVERIECCLEV